MKKRKPPKALPRPLLEGEKRTAELEGELKKTQLQQAGGRTGESGRPWWKFW